VDRNTQAHSSRGLGNLLDHNGIAHTVKTGPSIRSGDFESKVLEGCHLLCDLSRELGFLVHFYCRMDKLLLSELAYRSPDHSMFHFRVRDHDSVSSKPSPQRYRRKKTK